MQGMGGTMMAGGMQQRMAVGGNPGKDTHIFAQEDYNYFGENNLSTYSYKYIFRYSKLFPLYLCRCKPHLVFFQLIFSEGSEVDVTTNSGTKSSTIFHRVFY